MAKALKARKPRRTACVDLRRHPEHCGICGSEQIFAHVLHECEACSAQPQEKRIGSGCSCEVEQVHPVPWLGRPYATECMICGAVKGPRCPNCGLRIWRRGTQCHCQDCGLQIL